MSFRIRVLGVVAAVLLAELLWLVAQVLLGIRLQAPAGNGYPEPVDIDPLQVAIAAGVLSLLGWAVLAGLERLTPRGRNIWLGMALAGLAASLWLPLSGTGVSAENRAVLVLMHLVVAATVMTVLYRTSPHRAPLHPSLSPSAAQGEAA